MSDKHKNFFRLNVARQAKIIKAMRGLGKLSNKNNYHYSPLEAQSVVNSMQAEVDSLAIAFKVGLQHSNSIEPKEVTLGRSETGVIDNYDKEAIKAAFLKIADGDQLNGLKDLRKVILGWRPKDDQ